MISSNCTQVLTPLKAALDRTEFNTALKTAGLDTVPDSLDSHPLLSPRDPAPTAPVDGWHSTGGRPGRRTGTAARPSTPSGPASTPRPPRLRRARTVIWTRTLPPRQPQLSMPSMTRQPLLRTCNPAKKKHEPLRMEDRSPSH